MSPSGAVTTVAGRGVFGDPPRDGAGAAVTFSQSWAGIAVGSAGLYVADGTRVRLFSPGSGAVTTLSVFDFYLPYIAVNSTGAVFVFDEDSYRFCYVEGEACITAAGGGSNNTATNASKGFADGWGAAALFENVWGATFSTDGNLIIADGTRLRRMNASFFVDTLAGGEAGILDGVGTAARFASLTAVAADNGGGVFVADSLQAEYGNCIRHVSQRGVVTTLAGSCTAPEGSFADGSGAAARFNGIYGLAVDANDGLWVADSFNFAMRLVAAGACSFGKAYGVPSSDGDYADGGVSVAEFSSPSGIAFSTAAALIIVDAGNSRLRLVRVDTEQVSTLAGDGAKGWLDGTGAAASFERISFMAASSSAVYVSDAHRIRAVRLDGPAVTTTVAGRGALGFANGEGTHALFNEPRGLALSGSTLYVADAGNNRVRRVGLPALHGGVGNVSTLFGDGTCSDEICRPWALCLLGGAALLFSHGGAAARDSTILALYNASTGASRFAGGGGTGDGSSASSGFQRIASIAVAGDNSTVYVADYSAIRTVSPSGYIRTLLSGRENDLDPDFQATAADGGGGMQGDLLYGPQGIAISATGALYVAQADHIITVFSCGVAVCPAGSFCPTQLRSAQCPAGRFGHRAGLLHASCSGPCKSGTFCPTGGSAPIACPAGSFCPPESASPTPCAPGFYSAAPGRSSCLACAPGFLSPLPGGSTCDSYCPVGTFRKAYGGVNESSCTPCPAGWYADAVGSASCTSCDPGTASPAVGVAAAAACTACPAGTAAPAGSSSCAPCDAGYWAAVGAPACTPCPLGTFYSSMGATSPLNCTPCAAGTTTLSPGAALPSQCIAFAITCPAGAQPASPAPPFALSDCVPLACPPPLRFETANATSSRACAGCGSGTRGTPGSCMPCAAGELCPGFSREPLFSFPSLLQLFAAAPAAGGPRRALASIAAAATGAVAAACPPGTIVPPPAPLPALPAYATYIAFFCASIVLLCATSLMVVLVRAHPKSLDSLKKVDIFRMQHNFLDGKPVVPYRTQLGGFCSIWAIGLLLSFAAYMIQQ